jgi:hypothetical protein
MFRVYRGLGEYAADWKDESNVTLAESSVALQQIEERQNGDNDIVKRLQAICTNDDPTWLYKNLVKIGQG